ncbi:MAG: sulfatase-like hydrolase/transferase [Verrucomicrobia bacterium]|nr:sulfatase-like hydrolase/transferase [Verrucomicrobiota bacterium]
MVLLLCLARPVFASQPNFVLILGEAQGWASMSEPLDDRNVKGSKSDFILTPNLDSIAKAGVRFSDFYAASPRCTPTRAALVTGRSPAALHMTFVNEGKKDGGSLPGDKVISPQASTELPANIETMALMLKRVGYATAHFGKWHLGRENPCVHGFDENDGANSNGGPENVESPNPKQCYAIARQGMDFITRQVQAKKPFFLQISQYPGRGEETALPETVEAVKRRLGTRIDYQRIGLAAGDEEIDKTIGHVLAKLKEVGVMNNTYIIYTADHGAQGRNANGVLTNGKGTVWEGGLRVPLLVAGPGVKVGAFSHQRASTVDLLPTVAELAGIAASSLPKEIEGTSLTGVLQQGDAAPIKRAREELVIHFPHYDKDDLGPATAILLRDYKMIHFYEEDPRRRLFDVIKDLGEEHDLAAAKPDIVATLEKRLTDYLKLVNAEIPTSNPNYDPKGERSGDHKGGGGKGGGGKGGGKGKKGMQPTNGN